MLTVEIYKKNRKKIEKINDLISEANSLAERSYELNTAIKGIFDMAVAEVTKGLPPNSIPATPSLILRQGNILIEKDPIKAEITGILNMRMAELNSFPEPNMENIINKGIIDPYNLDTVNLLKISVRIKGGISEMTYTFSDGRQETVELNDISGDMIKEQTIKETKAILKSFIKALKKDVMIRGSFYTQFKKELEPFIVAERL